MSIVRILGILSGSVLSMVGVAGFQVNPMIWYLSLDETRQFRKIMLDVMLPERLIAFAGNRENALNRRSDFMSL